MISHHVIAIILLGNSVWLARLQRCPKICSVYKKARPHLEDCTKVNVPYNAPVWQSTGQCNLGISFTLSVFPNLLPAIAQLLP